MKPFALIWGGGDLASGVAMRLHRTGIRILIVERRQPLAVRRSVSFAQAVYDGAVTIEDITGILAESPEDLEGIWEAGDLPVLVDPDLNLIQSHKPLALVDARMRKKTADLSIGLAELVIGLGPGFTAGVNCHAAVETNRGHYLGRVYWEGSPEADTGIPGQVLAYRAERVLHAPCDGVVHTRTAIGEVVQAGAPVLLVDETLVTAPFSGIVRGLIHDGVFVKQGTKIGDVDPRPDTDRCQFVSEKSLAIGGGVLEALLTLPDIRQRLWD